MNIPKKILTSFLISIAMLSIGSLAHADAISSQSIIPDFKLQIPIEGLTAGVNIHTYLGAVYKWLMRAALIFSILMLVMAGIVWMVARGETALAKKAHDMIRSTLIGLGLALGSYTILFAVNKNLVNLDININFEKVIAMDLPIEWPEEDDSYEEPGPAQAPTPPTADGPNGTKGGAAVAKNGSIPLAQCTSKTINNLRIACPIVQSFDDAVTEIRSSHPDFKFVSVGGQSPRQKTSSCHNNGTAIDLNPDQNPCGPPCFGKPGVKVGSGEFRPYQDKRSVTKEIVQIFQKHGWCWGGNWKSFRDFHHFARCDKDCKDVNVYQFPSP